MKKKITITESQLKKIVDKIIIEQENLNPNTVTSQKLKSNPKLACVAPNEYNLKGSSGKAVVYKTRDGEVHLDDEGIARLWELNKNTITKRGEWECSSNNNSISVRWENDPKAIQYFNLPKNVFAKSIGSSLNVSKCAKEITDIYNGKFLFVGCKGPVVGQLQQRFKNLGYNLNVGNSFGNATKQVIMNFQKLKGINVDGVFGQSTLDFLVGDEINKKLKQQKKSYPQQKLATQNYPKDK